MIPLTEQDNPNSENIDNVPTIEALQIINSEDARVAEIVKAALPSIAKAIDQIIIRLQNGGRLFYIGTGSSGRLGVLDASEIPPTFGVSYEIIQGVIAGGVEALYKATESSEDSIEQGAADLVNRGLRSGDAVVGIAASGRTPYTIGAVKYAKELGCFTACISCVSNSPITNAVDIPIVAEVGPEVITGSTRMKAGTAQKMILNMISSVTMIRLGYVRGNRMTNVRSSNEKLKERSVRILIAESGLDHDEAKDLLNSSEYDLRAALVMHRASTDRETAIRALEKNGFVVEKAVSYLESNANT